MRGQWSINKKFYITSLIIAGLIFSLYMYRTYSIPQSDMPSATDSNAANPAGMEAAPQRTFGIIYPFANAFYEKITETAETAAESQSIQLIVKAPDEPNSDQQIRMLETMIKQKVDGIAISPIDPIAIAPHINKAVEQGIPVVCFETDAPNSKRYAYIGADPYQEGVTMGEMIRKRLSGTGMIMVESGLSSSLHQKSRMSGMLDYLKRFSDIKMLELRYNEGRRTQALSDLETMISNHPHFDILVTMDLVSSSAAILVWKAKGLTRTSLAFGMSPDSTEALQNGQINAIVSAYEETWGSQITTQLLNLSEGRPIPSWIDTNMKEVTKSELQDQL